MRLPENRTRKDLLNLIVNQLVNDDECLMVQLSEAHTEECLKQWEGDQLNEDPECICNIEEAEAKLGGLAQYLEAIIEELPDAS